MNIGQFVNHPPDTRTYGGWDGFVLPTTYVGVECEYEKVMNRDLPTKKAWSRHWVYHDETSLKDHGAEYAFVSPLFGSDAQKALEGIVAHATESKWACTKRTGLHVHLDVRNMGGPTLLGLALLYALYEPAIYKWVGDDRDFSVFCLPWYRAEGGVHSAASVLRSVINDTAAGTQETLLTLEGVDRYAGLNLRAMLEHGSVEFRQLRMTHKYPRIIDWINIIMSLKVGAENAPTCDGELLRRIEREGPRRVGRELMGPTFELLDYKELEDDVMQIGVPTALQLLLDGIEEVRWNNTPTFPKGEHKGHTKFMGGKPSPLAEAPVPVQAGFAGLQEQHAQYLYARAEFGRLQTAVTQARLDREQQGVTWTTPVHGAVLFDEFDGETEG